MDIRAEQPEDRAAIRSCNERAFGRAAEADVVDMIRSAGNALVSLVAVDGDQVVGHILFSPVTIAEAPADFRAVSLGPMSVIPERQNQGIGSRLVDAGLQACERGGCDAVVVLGHPSYYPRFGFNRAADHGLHNEYNADRAFMVRPLRGGALAKVAGLVKYAREFSQARC